MKKSTIVALYTFLTEMTDDRIDPIAMDDLSTEYHKLMDASNAKASAYDAAWTVVKDVLSDGVARTVKDICAVAGDTLPDGFTPNKVQYGLLNYWKDYVVKHDNGKSAKTYSLA